MVSHKGSLYLLAFAPEHNQVRSYKIDRIDEVHIGSTSFPKPSEQEIASRLAGSFGIYDGAEDVTVVVRFLPPAVRYVRELRWLPTRDLTDQPDGSLLAAVILEPESLRKAVAEEFAQLLIVYQTPCEKT
jgi:predicted DNA-binding transcriptional regulator YafY